MHKELSYRRFILSLSALILCYLLSELFFLNRYLTFSADEFWFTHIIHHYKTQLPYKDFAPYKTVLSYYLLVIPMFFTKNIITTMVSIKNMLAAINTVLLLLSAVYLKKFFSKSAILISMLMLLTSYLFLIYSTEIRGDLLSYWFCFFSLLLLLDKRFVLAGILLGLGFCSSQKALWFMLASNGMLATDFFLSPRKESIWPTLRFNLACLSVIACYLCFWSIVGGISAVNHYVFTDARILFKLDWYRSAQHYWWYKILIAHPLLFLATPLSLLSLLVTFPSDATYRLRLLIIVYSTIILICLATYQQIFLYYAEAAILPLFILYTALFTWAAQLYRTSPNLIMIGGEALLCFFLPAYFIFFTYLMWHFHLPGFYFLLLGACALFYYYLIKQERTLLKCNALILLFFIAYQFVYFITSLPNLNGHYQRTTLKNMQVLLQDGGDYVAGLEMLYDRDQPIAGLRHLTGPAIDYLYTQRSDLKPLMAMRSQYTTDEANIDSIIAALKKSKVKFYVTNYRMQYLPLEIKQYLAGNYAHYWGSIYLYAPLIRANTSLIHIKFSGTYVIETNARSTIQLAGKHYQNNDQVFLQAGSYVAHASEDYRLKLLPESRKLRLQASFAEDHWPSLLTVG